MTNQEINERVAKLCGWKYDRRAGLWRNENKPDSYEPEDNAENAPNYAESLDWCRSFEDSITGDEVGLYEHFIGEITQSYALALRRSFVGERMKLIRSTPLQRCEAFLQLKGQWE